MSGLDDAINRQQARDAHQELSNQFSAYFTRLGVHLVPKPSAITRSLPEAFTSLWSDFVARVPLPDSLAWAVPFQSTLVAITIPHPSYEAALDTLPRLPKRDHFGRPETRSMKRSRDKQHARNTQQAAKVRMKSRRTAIASIRRSRDPWPSRRVYLRDCPGRLRLLVRILNHHQGRLVVHHWAGRLARV